MKTEFINLLPRGYQKSQPLHLAVLQRQGTARPTVVVVKNKVNKSMYKQT